MFNKKYFVTILLLFMVFFYTIKLAYCSTLQPTYYANFDTDVTVEVNGETKISGSRDTNHNLIISVGDRVKIYYKIRNTQISTDFSVSATYDIYPVPYEHLSKTSPHFGKIDLGSYNVLELGYEVTEIGNHEIRLGYEGTGEIDGKIEDFSCNMMGYTHKINIRVEEKSAFSSIPGFSFFSIFIGIIVWLLSIYNKHIIVKFLH